eukprot:10687567-Karenia_brevis.AAC.1
MLKIGKHGVGVCRASHASQYSLMQLQSDEGTLERFNAQKFANNVWAFAAANHASLDVIAWRCRHA